jgi:hypothetical protein
MPAVEAERLEPAAAAEERGRTSSEEPYGEVAEEEADEEA